MISRTDFSGESLEPGSTWGATLGPESSTHAARGERSPGMGIDVIGGWHDGTQSVGWPPLFSQGNG